MDDELVYISPHPFPMAYQALVEVAKWLGFEHEHEYNNWCQGCTEEQFRQRLDDAK